MEKLPFNAQAFLNSTPKGAEELGWVVVTKPTIVGEHHAVSHIFATTSYHLGFATHAVRTVARINGALNDETTYAENEGAYFNFLRSIYFDF